MTGKKVAFGTKPSNKPAAAPSAEEWVKNREEGTDEPTKRLTPGHSREPAPRHQGFLRWPWHQDGRGNPRAA